MHFCSLALHAHCPLLIAPSSNPVTPSSFPLALQTPIPGTIPASYGSANHLRHLQLRGHRLTGPIPALPPTLQLLDVSFNQLDGPFPDLSHANALDYVDVSHNRLAGALPKDLSQVPLKAA